MDAVNHIQLIISPNQVKPILQALLSSIFFHRTLDNVEPETIEIFDNHIASCSNPAITKEILTKIDEFVKEYLETGQERGEIAIVFLERRPRKGWFAVTEELIPWEEHLITLHFPRKTVERRDIPADLSRALLALLKFCAEKKGHVPPLTNESGQNNISYQILINPPPPSELFSPSPPSLPTRITSPPPQTTLATATSTSGDSRGAAGVGAAMGYLESMKDGVRAVGVGVSRGWGGRAGSGRGG